MKRACPQCGRVEPCAIHIPYTGTRNRDRDLNAHKRWARRIKARDHGTCQACGATKDLHAHHTHGIHDDRGVTLCRSCHKAADQYAR